MVLWDAIAAGNLDGSDRETCLGKGRMGMCVFKWDCMYGETSSTVLGIGG